MATANETRVHYERSAADGLVLRTVSLPAAQVVYLKSLLEAYPGMAMVVAPARAPHAPRARVRGGLRSRLTVVTPPGFADDVDALLAELGSEIDLRVEGATGHG